MIEKYSCHLNWDFLKFLKFFGLNFFVCHYLAIININLKKNIFLK